MAGAKRRKRPDVKDLLSPKFGTTSGAGKTPPRFTGIVSRVPQKAVAAIKPSVPRRPTVAQLLKSQKRVIGYMAKSGKTLEQTASVFEVSRQQLEKFLFQPRKKTRRAYNLTYAYSDIFEKTGIIDEKTGKFKLAGPIKEVRRVPRVLIKRVVSTAPETRGEITERIIIRGVTPEARRRASIITQATLLEHKTPSASMTIAWQIYTEDKGVPSTMDGIREYWDAGEISRSQLKTILNHWRVIYAIDEDYFNDFMDEHYFDIDDFMEEDEY